MSVVEPGPAWRTVAARLWALLTRPTATWDRIDLEPATTRGLYRDWDFLDT